MHSLNKPKERFNGRVTETVYNVSLTDSELMILKESILSDYEKTVASLTDLSSEILNNTDYKIGFLLSSRKAHITQLFVIGSDIDHILKTEVK
jgi:hypothetical protein